MASHCSVSCYSAPSRSGKRAKRSQSALGAQTPAEGAAGRGSRRAFSPPSLLLQRPLFSTSTPSNAGCAACLLTAVARICRVPGTSRSQSRTLLRPTLLATTYTSSRSAASAALGGLRRRAALSAQRSERCMGRPICGQR